jgi:hypothetical protein
MDAERRDHPRQPLFTQGELIIDDRLGGDMILPILLRDFSDSGLGAVSVGQSRPPREGQYQLRTAAGEAWTVQLAWTRQVADYVYLLGLHVLARPD